MPVCSVPTSLTVPDEPCNSFLTSLPPSCSVRYSLQEQDVALFRARTLTFLTLTIIIVYGVYYWAKTKYDYYNSKQGHFDHLIEEGVIKPGQYERPTVGPVVH